MTISIHPHAHCQNGWLADRNQVVRLNVSSQFPQRSGAARD